jgi:hypothetical protein
VMTTFMMKVKLNLSRNLHNPPLLRIERGE